MKADLLASKLFNNPSKEHDTHYKQYHTTLLTLIDKHAPLHTKHTKVKYIPGWVNKTVIAAKRPSVCLNTFGAEINPPSIDTSACRKSTITTESGCRPNLNSLKQRFRIISTTNKNYGVSWVMCYTDFQLRSSH